MKKCLPVDEEASVDEEPVDGKVEQANRIDVLVETASGSTQEASIIRQSYCQLPN